MNLTMHNSSGRSRMWSGNGMIIGMMWFVVVGIFGLEAYRGHV
jgi:hypothetical protein